MRYTVHVVKLQDVGIYPFMWVIRDNKTSKVRATAFSNSGEKIPRYLSKRLRILNDLERRQRK